MAKKDYGSKGQAWHPQFIKYMDSIVGHPVFKGMPDALKDDGKVQWEAPSNRSSGQYQHTHAKRLDWWRKKAASIGIPVDEKLWISTTAKRIHPYGAKPCKRCGRVMEIRYAYLGKRLRARLERDGYVLGDDPLHVVDLVRRLHASKGYGFLAKLPDYFGSDFPARLAKGTIDDVVAWLDKEFIPSEPALLSPGCMANPPDRLDGFHSFNLCCRKRADKGRSDGNLATYVTDRRVFEYWADGDWICADRMMGEVRANFRSERCLNRHPGPCDADHIGPISLGFAHNPHFQLLCGACNSAKNNRMSLADVKRLIALEASGEGVISWHAAPVWELLKHRVATDENALRLSKIMRDNRHTYMRALSSFKADGLIPFLIFLLNLEYAGRQPRFLGLKVLDHQMAYEGIAYEPRTNKYAMEQKVRRCRIALSSLATYFEKENRNSFFVESPALDESISQSIGMIRKSGLPPGIDSELCLALSNGTAEDAVIRRMLASLPSRWPQEFNLAKSILTEGLKDVALRLATMWGDERYLRDSVR